MLVCCNAVRQEMAVLNQLDLFQAEITFAKVRTDRNVTKKSFQIKLCLKNAFQVQKGFSQELPTVFYNYSEAESI